MTHAVDDRSIATQLRMAREPAQRCDEEPGEPDALALSEHADAAHAIVPVARADQRQPMIAARACAIERAHAMLVQRARGLADDWLVVDLVLVRLERPHVEIRGVLIPDASVATHFHVVVGAEGQPREVVGEPRAHAASARLVPPVLDVALPELPSRRAQEVRLRHRGFGVHKGHAVLELIAESEGAARLVDRRPRPHAAGECLVERPAIHQRVQVRRRRFHANDSEPVGPRAHRGVSFRTRGIGRTGLRNDFAHGVFATRRAEQQDHLARFARLQRDRAPQRRARVESGGEAPRQFVEPQRRGRTEVAIAADERRAIAAGARCRLTDPRECHLRREVLVEAILREDGAGGRIPARVDVIARLLAIRAQHELDIAGEHDRARIRPLVLEAQARDLHRRFARHGQRKRGTNARAAMVERADARRMDDVVRRGSSLVVLRGPRAGCRTPDMSGVGVLQVDHLTGGITHRIVEPRREPIEVAVLRPGEAAAALRDAEARAAIGDHVGPRTRRDVASVHLDPVVGGVRQCPEPVARRRAWENDRVAHLKHGGNPRANRCAFGAHRGGDDFTEAHAVADHVNARDRSQQRDVSRGEDIAAADVHTSRHFEHSPFARGDDHRRELVLELLDVRWFLGVQDDEVGLDALGAPVVVRHEQLADTRQAGLGADRGEDHGPVTGDAMRPECGLRPAIRRALRLWRAHGFPWIDERARELLVEGGGGGRDVEVAELDLRNRPRQRERTLRRTEVVVTIGGDERFLPRFRHDRGEGNGRRVPGLEANANAECGDGIEDRAGMASERAGCVKGGWRLHRSSAADEHSAVGFASDLGDRFRADRGDVRAPGPRLVRRAWAPTGQHRALVRNPFRLHEEILERRVRAIGTGGGEDDLAVACELDVAIHPGAIGQRDPTNLGAFARDDDDLRSCVDAVVAAREGRAIGGERDMVGRRGRTHRLVRGGPDRTRRDVADVDPLPGRIACGIRAPAKHVHVAAAAVSAAGIREQHAVRWASQEADARLRRVRRVELAERHARAWRAHERIPFVDRLCLARGVAARHALVEQQGGRANCGIAQEPPLPDSLPPLEIDGVVERNDGHPDVMRHERSHDGRRARRFRSRVVEGVVEPVRAVRTDALERGEVRQRNMRRHCQRQCTGVRRDHEVTAEAALEGKVGHAEGAILIGLVPIAHVVRRFRKAPRHAARVPVGDLPTDCRLMRLVEQRVRTRRHHEHRHEVLEHASAPRHQRRS